MGRELVTILRFWILHFMLLRASWFVLGAVGGCLCCRTFGWIDSLLGRGLVLGGFYLRTLAMSDCLSLKSLVRFLRKLQIDSRKQLCFFMFQQGFFLDDYHFSIFGFNLCFFQWSHLISYRLYSFTLKNYFCFLNYLLLLVIIFKGKVFVCQFKIFKHHYLFIIFDHANFKYVDY